MEKNVFTREELAVQTGVPEADLDAWAKAKLLKPLGFADEGMPFYVPADVDRALHLKKLREIGYGFEEIQKIVKKFGFPKTEGGASKAGEKDKLLTVGRLAERTDLSPRTIKHWEEMGIIEPEMRSGGGFRLYAGVYVDLCRLIRDLQLFGYTLEEIKTGSGTFRDFLALQKDSDAFPREAAALKLDEMLRAIEGLHDRMRQLAKGIDRWEGLLKKKKKEIVGLKARNDKRPPSVEEGSHA